jgi:glycosyltransferase involved in cell wall biosynthesis
MRGSAYYFADRARKRPADLQPDLIFASDFLNLADWRALCPPAYRNIPCILYFHENQLTYPLSEQAPIDYHYGWINLSSALTADHVLFNSSYQKELFLGEVSRVLQRMPDFVPETLVSELRSKCDICPVGLDFEPHEKLYAERNTWSNPQPVILWNHRWEFDKNPEGFVESLIDLAEKKVDFRVVICGESFGKSHPAFETAARVLGDRIPHLGFFPSTEEYRKVAASCDVVVSTARHEFFGVAVVEAIYLGCLPVLPNRLSYPEIIPPHLHPLFLYEDRTPLADFLARFIGEPPIEFSAELHEAVDRFHWRNLAPLLDSQLQKVAGL